MQQVAPTLRISRLLRTRRYEEILMAKPLVIFVTQGDCDLDAYVKRFGTRDDITIKRYSSNPKLGHYDGGGTQPLVLIGHANEERFVTAEGSPRVRASGNDVATALKGMNLQAKTFAVCLIAGCSAAGKVGARGLFVGIGDGLQIPVIASTTTAKISVAANDKIDLEPIAGGTWKAYYPESNEACALSHDRCAGLRETASQGIFNVQESK
jgi:hypothetical protein